MPTSVLSRRQVIEVAPRMRRRGKAQEGGIAARWRRRATRHRRRRPSEFRDVLPGQGTRETLNKSSAPRRRLCSRPARRASQGVVVPRPRRATQLDGCTIPARRVAPLCARTRVDRLGRGPTTSRGVRLGANAQRGNAGHRTCPEAPWQTDPGCGNVCTDTGAPATGPSPGSKADFVRALADPLQPGHSADHG